MHIIRLHLYYIWMSVLCFPRQALSCLHGAGPTWTPRELTNQRWLQLTNKNCGPGYEICRLRTQDLKSPKG